jgi:hypothetical protein
LNSTDTSLPDSPSKKSVCPAVAVKLYWSMAAPLSSVFCTVWPKLSGNERPAIASTLKL